MAVPSALCHIILGDTAHVFIISISQFSENIMVARKTQDQWISDVMGKHGTLYDYSLVNYLSAHKPVTIICRKHGPFMQRANDHNMGKGCPSCANDIRSVTTGNSKRKSHQDFLIHAKRVHGETYDYSKTQYTSSFEKITVTCAKHGDFIQSPASHLEGYGCARCSKGRVSNTEIAWLDLHKIPLIYRQVPITVGKRRVVVDGFDPSTNTVYEFYGDWWHGNPEIYPPNDMHVLLKKTYSQLYEKTIMRENLLKSHGYHMITVWENVFKASLIQG